jgi:multisubunit Na+/H+ antiporter MnhG subunit
VGRASGSAGAMGAMLVLLGLAFWFGASAATVAHWSANLLLSVTFLSLINAVGKA